MSQDPDYIVHSKPVDTDHIDISSPSPFPITSFVGFPPLESPLTSAIHSKLFQGHSSSNDGGGGGSDGHLSNMDFDEDCFVDCDSSRCREGGNEKRVLGMKDYRKVFLPAWV